MSRRLTDFARRLRDRARRQPDSERPDPPKPGAKTPAPDRPAPAPDIVRAYHERSKHHPSRYARALGYLDWDQQPDPFRRWTGAPLVVLPLVPPSADPGFEAAGVHGHVVPRAPDLAAIGQLFMDALALSAWKQAGDNTWPLRVDPSSGNLHPTEGWLIAPALPGLGDRPAVYHYSPLLHALERRVELSDAAWTALAGDLPDGSVLVALSSIWWRESWKYGERAFRYCQHDLGHCLGTLAYAAAGLGWRASLLEGADDAGLNGLLGLDDWPEGWPVEEQEHAEALIVLSPSALPVQVWRDWRLPDVGPLAHAGTPNLLSAEHHSWPVIEDIHLATHKAGPAPTGLYDAQPLGTGLTVGDAPLGLRPLIHQRRSAVALDGRTGITRDAFVQILRKLLPGPDQVPHSLLPWRPRVHLALFVHRVADVEPGLYLLGRDAQALTRLRSLMSPDLAWTPVPGVPPELPLVLLTEGDCRAQAQQLSCGQDIASDGVFAVAMLGELAAVLDEWGAWGWKRLHWEAGLIGQILYLEAEATGIRGTGIGCFFDDPTHRALLSLPAWREDQLVDLYHFTMGGPVEDDRLQTLPAYAHRDALLAAESDNG